jgi:hypothetical protein
MKIATGEIEEKRPPWPARKRSQKPPLCQDVITHVRF